MRYVIGDVHGEITKLKSLMDHITTQDARPAFTFVGDYLDKGEDPIPCLRYLIELSGKYDCTFLIGNHEYVWLNIHDNFDHWHKYILNYGGEQTIRSAGKDNILDTREALMEEFQGFFDKMVNYWYDDSFFVAHSGINPEDFDLQSDQIPQKRLLFNRYEFLKTEKLYLGKYKVIFGHTPFYTPYLDPYKIGLDTAAFYLDWLPLTAFCLDNMYFYNSNKVSFPLDFEQTVTCPSIPRVKTDKYGNKK